jgi:hypothetical protein
MPTEKRRAVKQAGMSRYEAILAEAAIRATLERHGRVAHRGEPCRLAHDWFEAGFDAGAVESWLLARCFNPVTAARLTAAEPGPDSPRLHSLDR